jgi:hypothetical protein
MQPLIEVKGGHRFGGPTRCGCGRKGKFTLLSFEEIPISFVPEGYEVKQKEEPKKPSKRKKK